MLISQLKNTPFGANLQVKLIVLSRRLCTLCRKFHEYLVRNQMPHRYIPKRSAPWNGKVERANRSVDDEYYLNWGRPWKTIAEYTRWYNNERPHVGKGMYGMTPKQKYLSFCAQGNP